MHASVRTFAVLGGHVRLVAPRVTRGSRRGADAQGWAQVGGSGGESAGCCCHSLRCTRGSLTREPSVGCRAARDRGGPGRRHGRLVCVLSCGAAGGAGGRPWWSVRRGARTRFRDSALGLQHPPHPAQAAAQPPRAGPGTTRPWPLAGSLHSSPWPLPGLPASPKARGQERGAAAVTS